MSSDPVPLAAIYDASSDGRSLVAAANFAAMRTLLDISAFYASIGHNHSGVYSPVGHTHAQSDITDLTTDLAGKQETLVSGTNLKTINSISLLGSDDIVVSASPAGSSGQVQYNNAGAFGGAVAIVYAGSGTHLSVTAQGSSVIAACFKAAASQTVNIFESQISTGAVRARINSIGDFSNPRTGNEAECFGASANAGEWGTAIGKGAANNSGYGFAGGRNASAHSAAVSVGAGSSAVDDSVAIGYTANAAHSKSYVFGRGAASSAVNQVVFLDSNHLLLTGTTAKFSTSTSFEVFQIDRNTTAGQTRLLLWDIDKGSLQRVSIGASDSGGTGFKLLRVPN